MNPDGIFRLYRIHLFIFNSHYLFFRLIIRLPTFFRFTEDDDVRQKATGCFYTVRSGFVVIVFRQTKQIRTISSIEIGSDLFFYFENLSLKRNLQSARCPKQGEIMMSTRYACPRRERREKQKI